MYYVSPSNQQLSIGAVFVGDSQPNSRSLQESDMNQVKMSIPVKSPVEESVGSFVVGVWKSASQHS